MMIIYPLIRKLCAATVVLILLACVGVQPTQEQPRVSLAGIAVKEIKSLETAFQIQLRVMNPNESTVTIKGIDCELEINGKPFAAGVVGIEKTIPPYDTELVPVVLYSSVLDMANRIIGMIRSVQTSKKLENLDYELKGKLRLKTPSGAKMSRFNARGVLSLEELNTINPKP